MSFLRPINVYNNRYILPYGIRLKNSSKTYRRAKQKPDPAEKICQARVFNLDLFRFRNL